MQWDGTVTATMIEAGAGWMSVQTAASNVPPDVLYLTPVANIVNRKQLSSFAVGSQEVRFFGSNNVSLSYSPYLVADSTGYNSGNTFTGNVSCVLQDDDRM